MLDRLPPEVILTISRLLTQQDKLILITTCRHLFNLISQTNLYPELNLVKHEDKTEEIIRKFIGNLYPGSQVKKLSFDITKVPDQLLFQLPIIFPNITQVRTQHYMRIPQHHDKYAKCPIINWCNTLEIYNISIDWPGMISVLKTTTFTRLTELELGYSYTFPDKKEGFDTPYFLPHLKNSPSLKKLELACCAIDLEFLEKLHAYCPDLESLELSEMHIIVKNDTLSQPIMPADSLLYLDITYPSCFDTKGLFLNYITTKYRCLKKLDFLFDKDGYDISEFSTYYKRFNIYGDAESDVDDIPDRQEYIQMYNSLKNDYDRTLAVYKQSGTRFFSNLTPSIESIYIECSPFDNTIEALANSNTKLTFFDYGDDVKDPNEIQHITGIKHLKKLYIHVLFPEQFDLQMFPSTSITELTLSNYGHDVAFDWLLEMFPLVKDLTLYGGRWTTPDNGGDAATRYPDLCQFRASVRSFDQKCLDFLTKTTPNLKVLDLFTSNSAPATCGMNIDISGWELQELHLKFNAMEFNGDHYFNIKTHYLDQVIRYIEQQRTLALVKNRSYSFDNTKPFMFNIICDDNMQFMFFGSQISLAQKKIMLLSTNKQ